MLRNRKDCVHRFVHPGPGCRGNNFGRSNLIQDAPISRIDLLACRNSLMYFNAQTKVRILSPLAFALRPGGVLFLGRAEMLLTHAELFEPIDLKRFFRKVRASGPIENEPTPSRSSLMRRRDPADEWPLVRSEAFLASPVARSWCRRPRS